MAANASSEVSEGPVMGLISKRLRALRKKYNRITQMEESISQGKSLNKEQQDVLRSKSSVVVLIDELEKLRAPLSVAVSEEISLATKHNHEPAPSSDQSTATEEKEAEIDSSSAAATADTGLKLEDLVNLLYFGSLFDVKSQNEFTSIMLTRTHERGCCLTYDYVTDDATDMLGDRDLDSISQLWSLMVSRPADSSLSHKNALERCVEHAKLWLANSDQPIESNCDVSYAALREKLKKIMDSDYFTTTPEMKAPVEVAAAANYASFQATSGEDVSNGEEQGLVVNEQSLQDENQKVESVTEGEEVVHGQQEQGYTQVGGENVNKREYVPRGTYQNQRGERGARRGGRRGYSNGRGGGGGGRGGSGGGGYQNGGRYESYDNSGGNGYSRSYYNNRGRGRRGGAGGGGGNGQSYQDSNVTM